MLCALWQLSPVCWRLTVWSAGSQRHIINLSAVRMNTRAKDHFCPWPLAFCNCDWLALFPLNTRWEQNCFCCLFNYTSTRTCPSRPSITHMFGPKGRTTYTGVPPCFIPTALRMIADARRLKEPLFLFPLFTDQILSAPPWHLTVAIFNMRADIMVWSSSIRQTLQTEVGCFWSH